MQMIVSYFVEPVLPVKAPKGIVLAQQISRLGHIMPALVLPDPVRS